MQGFPSFKTPHWGVLKFTPFGAPEALESFAPAGATKGRRPLETCHPLKKGKRLALRASLGTETLMP